MIETVKPDSLVGMFSVGGLSHEQVMRSIELFATRVMPALGRDPPGMSRRTWPRPADPSTQSPALAWGSRSGFRPRAYWKMPRACLWGSTVRKWDDSDGHNSSHRASP